MGFPMGFPGHPDGLCVGVTLTPPEETWLTGGISPDVQREKWGKNQAEYGDIVDV